MKSYSTYIFDLDGTITNTGAVWLDIFREGLLSIGFPPPDDKTLSLFTHDWNALVQIGVPIEKIADFEVFAVTAANKRLADSPFHAGALDALLKLKKQEKRIAIFSTMQREVFEPAMQHRNLYAIAEVAIAGSDVPHRKPHPAGIFKALEDLGIAQEDYQNAVYIGDKDTDIQAANNAGIDSILFYPVAHQVMYDLKELEQHKPTHIITDWQELLVK